MIAPTVEIITDQQSQKILATEEGQFADVKSADISPGKLTKNISAFANSDGGDLYIGITEDGPDKVRGWKGFSNQEAANSHLQVVSDLFPLGGDVDFQFLRCDGRSGLILHIQINKTKQVVKASNKLPYFRRGAQSLPADTPELIRRLDYLKGISSFESEPLNVPAEMITDSDVVKQFVAEVVPKVAPKIWLKKQLLLQSEKPTVAGALLFADEPQAIIPKRCGIKIYRYKTTEAQGSRDTLAFDPKTVEGCLYKQIKTAVRMTAEIAEEIPKLGEDALESIKYPAQTLHEIITNAVIHRDYSMADDVHIRVFENRVEIESPGRLPAHITVENILTERVARNGAVVRILNKFPDPPNKDVGEGLNTAFEAMHQLGLKAPLITERENSVLVVIRHERLASAEEAIMDYLAVNSTIKNAQARHLTHVRMDHQIKTIFGRMVKAGMIEQVPGTRTSKTAYRKKSTEPLPQIRGAEEPNGQQTLF